MTVSMNGMTVLAAGEDPAAETVADISADVGTPGDTGTEEPASEDGAEVTAPDGDAGSIGSDENAGDKQQEETQPDGADDETPAGDAKEDPQEQTPDGNESDESLSENEMDDADTQEPETAEEEIPEEAPADQTAVQLMSFTDDVGITITYDAVEVDNYKITVEDGILKEIKTKEDEAVSGNVVLPEDQGITKIGSKVFENNENITYVKLPAGVTDIEESAFSGCSKMQGIYMPPSLVNVGQSAFAGCSSLAKIALPKGVKTIGDNAFLGDTSLFMVYMKDADYGELVSVGADAFNGCVALAQFCSDTAFVLPESLNTIGAGAFQGCKAIKDADLQKVSELGEKAFLNCTSLRSVELSAKLGSIPKEAFKGCTALTGVTFGNGIETIGENAFEGCYNLGGLSFGNAVKEIKEKAFTGCTNLVCVEIPNPNITIADSAFEKSDKITFVSTQGSAAEKYAKNKNFKFVGYKETGKRYLYTVKVITGDTTGTITVTDQNGEDPNKKNNGEGVPMQYPLYVDAKPKGSYQLVEGSVKCNGVVLNKNSSGKYETKMPMGGAMITAEFELMGGDANTLGTENDIRVEISNGIPDRVTDGSVGEVTLKVGQTTRMFLIDEKDENKAISSSKITYKVEDADPAGAVKVNAGIISAVQEGNATVRASVKSANGNLVTKDLVVKVIRADVKKLKVRAKIPVDLADIVQTEVDEDEIQTVAVDKRDVRDEALTFTLNAVAYDEAGDDMSAALKWTTSDAEVAQIDKKSTTADSPVNTVTIPKGTDGEAMITATATNTAEDGTKETVVQRFIVSVYDGSTPPKLVSNTLTLDPDLTQSAILEIISSSYSKTTIDHNKVKLCRQGETSPWSNFTCTYLEDQSDKDVMRFCVTASDTCKNNQSYKLDVLIDDSEPLPLTITVKKSTPKPKVTFDKVDKKQPKINLFLKQDTTEIPITITGLGMTEVETFALEGLSNKDDDKLFADSFQVEKGSVKNTCVISLKKELQYTSKKKPAVTGYLVLHYEGYKESADTKIKITVPTQTVKPSYVLSKTSGTYRTGSSQKIVVELLDKKTKEFINLSADDYQIAAVEGSTISAAGKIASDEADKGKIQLTLSSVKSGNIKLRLTCKNWSESQKFDFTYKVKAVNADPKISLNGSSVKLNKRYGEATFTLKSDQDNVWVAKELSFHGPSAVPIKQAAGYSSLTITYADGVGKVAVKPGVSSISNGTYTFICDKAKYADDPKASATKEANQVTVKVVVSDSQPSVSVKGSVSLNRNARKTDGGQGTETGEFTLTAKNLSEGYVIDPDQTTAKIVCTTRGKESAANYFDWAVEKDKESGKDKLQVSIKNAANPVNATYKFSCTPVFKDESGKSVEGKAFSFSVKVHSGEIGVSLSAKGKLNLLDRNAAELTTANSIIYTPKFTNIKDTVSTNPDDVKIFDVIDDIVPTSSLDAASTLFEVIAKDDGKLYVTPKKGAELESGKTYKVRIWMKLQNYQPSKDEGGLWSKTLSIKTAQTLPKVQTDVGTVNLFLSNKNYKAEFVVDKKDVKALGAIESVTFDEKDTKALESFVTDPDGLKDTKDETPIEITSKQQEDGSLKVTLQLKKTVAYSSNSTNKVKMYVRFAGQGPNTAGTAITMNVKINK